MELLLILFAGTAVLFAMTGALAHVWAGAVLRQAYTKNDPMLNQEPLTVGTYGEGSGDFWEGTMNDLRFYSGAVSPNDAWNIYQRQRLAAHSKSGVLIGHFSAEEATETTVPDLAGKTGAALLVAKQSGSRVAPGGIAQQLKAFSFNGRGDFLKLPPAAYRFGHRDAFSFFAWVRPAALNGYRSVISKVKGSAAPDFEPHLSTHKYPFVPGDWNGYTFFVDEKNQDYRYLRVQFGDMEGPRRIDVNTQKPLLRLGTWQHIGFTYDGSGLAKGVRFFYNGKEAPGRVLLDAIFGIDERARRLAGIWRRHQAKLLAVSGFLYAAVGYGIFTNLR